MRTKLIYVFLLLLGFSNGYPNECIPSKIYWGRKQVATISHAGMTKRQWGESTSKQYQQPVVTQRNYGGRRHGYARTKKISKRKKVISIPVIVLKSSDDECPICVFFNNTLGLQPDENTNTLLNSNENVDCDASKSWFRANYKNISGARAITPETIGEIIVDQAYEVIFNVDSD